MLRYVLLAFLVALAGCSSLFPGGDVVKINPVTTTQGFKDVLVIHDIVTIPTSPVLPDADISLSFIIENKDTEKSATHVFAEIIDGSVFKSKDGEPCNAASKPCQPRGECSKERPCSILPQGQEQIEFRIKAPSTKDIVGLKTETTIYFRVQYEFKGSTFFENVVVNMDEALARQRAGQPVSISKSSVIGSGPMQIEAESQGAQFIFAGRNGAVTFRIVSRGDSSKGGILNSKIERHALTIHFPAGLGTVAAPDSDATGAPKFSCVPDGDSIVCTNSEELNLYKGASIPYAFRFIKVSEIAEPFRTFPITAVILYEYEIRDSVKITVQPEQR